MKIKNSLKAKKGFTLIELVVVIAILAVLGTVAGISGSFFVRKANEKSQKTAVETAYNSIQSVLVEVNSGFSTYGSLRDAFQSVLDDSIRACEQYSNNEKFKEPSAESDEGYYIVCVPVKKKDANGNEYVSGEWALSLLFYVKDGNVWAYKGAVLYKNGTPST